ncbi:MAG: hypothetical protein IJ928_05090 [Prevotella sp.]|nr:hypothetical protein [Prevotella sp.]
MKKTLLTVLAVACLISCETKTNKESKNVPAKEATKEFRIIDVEEEKVASSREEYMKSLSEGESSNSLVSWISDSAFYANPRLMMLLDTLCLHVYADEFPADVKKEEKWMAQMRNRLCAYYDSQSREKRSISAFAKADTVLNIGSRQLEIDCSWTTADMVMNAGTNYTFDQCRAYGLLTQLIGQCQSQEAKEAVYKEWRLYEKVSEKFGEIASNISLLSCWGGSIVGPMVANNMLSSLQARREMCQTVLNMVNNDNWDSTGVLFSDAEQLLYTSSKKALKILTSGRESDYFTDSKEIARDTEKAIQELKPLIKEWRGALKKVDQCLDEYECDMERAASNLLMKWASIITASISEE